MKPTPRNKTHRWAAYGHWILNSRLHWLRSTQPGSRKIPHLEEVLQRLRTQLQAVRASCK